MMSVTVEQALATPVLVCLLLAGSLIDLRSRRLPDWVTLSLVACGLVLAFASGGSHFVWSAAGVVVGFASLWFVRELYFRFTGRDGLGLGDAKLLAGAGAWLGPLLLAPVVFIAATSGLVAVALLKVAGRPVSLASTVPFGPFLSLGLAACWAAKMAGVT